ncbi:methylated-DNA--[protein]-cysteine S-methyltransferase [Kingella kingae]|nr:methylated-DNA--[protein]-cysteine S-methyltransferase [Kingella kingae]MDK4527861.1 methylated-DNA--[protein]-cysteine S-methyltransferase [Kingella kingae]MDK4542532.1 methylated-DNA--[protein]-cysteine S-methyltransferase [Kingella kingae]MDK4544282.1 methylated-DNA--[protein]-cysteine S-methyltransferase [Kingella kingae]MDK4562321.1 methylated-DNA--[protein]-cysteine S-methyltransferase [Kingella kingae]MDK4565859.1 methylated-DNA--[protein]-cysteine S-methyltransferase [Kingella kinga
MTLPLLSQTLATPIGDLCALFSPKGLCLLEFADQANLAKMQAAIVKQYGKHIAPAPQNHAVYTQLRDELRDYFASNLHTFNVPLDPIGTAFEQQVWQALLQIPYGSTISYAEQARRIGKPTAVRAVAAANGRNRISIVIPCHRVIGSNGRLTGYAGGVERKQFLLQLENNAGCLL